MRPFTLLARQREIGCMLIGLLLGGCSRGDLSQYLGAGRCDDQGLCAAGYVCEASTWECLKAGTIRDGGSGQSPDMPLDPKTDPKSDARSPESDVRGLDGPSARDLDASTDSPVVASDVRGLDGPSAPDLDASTDSPVVASDVREPDSASAPGLDAGTDSPVVASDVREPDSASTSQPDACPPGGCVCGEGLSNCGGACVDLGRDDKHCGSCTGTCVVGSVKLVCGTVVAGGCDCAGDDARCGSADSTGQCSPATGLCVCGGTTCTRGEVCRADAIGRPACSCDGLAGCTQGMTCCLGYGCADLDTASDHCGACGKSCPKLHYCQTGACRCRNAKACEAGASGVCTSQGRCQCDSVVCAPGQRCVAPGVCG